jgi:chromosome segregation protein
MDRWVTSERPELAGLPGQLLGKTLVVDDLPVARALAKESHLGGYRFVTRAGELLASDGTITVGPLRGESGIVSRKSELRELLAQAAGLDAEIAIAERRSRACAIASNPWSDRSTDSKKKSAP